MKKQILKCLVLSSVLLLSSCSFFDFLSNSSNNNQETSSEITSNINSKGNYFDFTSSEKEILNYEYGFVIPFVECQDYVLEYDSGNAGYCYLAQISSSTFTFRRYLSQFKTNYTYDGSFYSNGLTWYQFTYNDCTIFLTNYSEYGTNYIQVNIQKENSGDENDNLLTNHGKGLPSGKDGVFDVDFTKGLIKNVTEQYTYSGGCPTTTDGNETLNVLVIPVEFKDCTASSKGYTLSALETAFNGSSDTLDYYSLKDYYYTSSYGKLNINFDIMDSWYQPSQKSSYYKNATFRYGASTLDNGEQIILNEFLIDNDSNMDFSKYDSDNNGSIDAVIMVNTLDIDSTGESQFNWAFRYWNYYVDGNYEPYTYDEVYVDDYLWASYQFLYEVGSTGDYTGNKNPTNTYTFLHEFGHVLGLDDYYDTAYQSTGPLNKLDMMDSTVGDQNPYSKFNLGWITSSRLITGDNVTVDLQNYENSGDTIIIANDWDEELGLYQEYYVLMYYTNDKLNKKGGYFTDEGILMYHVNASLEQKTYYGETYYDVYNNNTSYTGVSGYGTKNNLVEYVKYSSKQYVYKVGNTSSSSITNSYGEKIPYTFKVDSLSDSKATLTFTKVN